LADKTGGVLPPGAVLFQVTLPVLVGGYAKLCCLFRLWASFSRIYVLYKCYN